MKKKILFVIPEYSIGGTNTSLKNLLEFIDNNRYDVYVYCLYEDGPNYFKKIFRPYIIHKSLLYYLAHDNIITRKIMGALMKISNSITFNWLYKIESNRIQNKYKFDTLIAFQEGSATNFVSQIKHNPNKISWVHCDYAILHNGQAKELHIYSKFKKILCVSKAAKNSFDAIYPLLSNKTFFLYNVLNSDSIISLGMSKKDLFESDTYNILSLGRLAKVKQFEMIPQIASEIKELTKAKFHWYIMGNGEETKQIILESIANYNVSECVTLLPGTDNPYPYIKESNLLISTSTSESCPYVVNEAKILHTPVICNNYPSSIEMIDKSVGWICNINDMAKKIAEIINNKDGIYSKVKESIASYRYDNEVIMSKFYKLID